METRKDGEETDGLVECRVCSNGFELPPRNSEGGLDRAIDLSFSHIPKLLSGCLHTVCQSCAEEALQRSSSATVLPCPVCSVSSTGVLTTSSLTNDVIALQDVKRLSSNCDFCDDVVRASHRCSDCESILCIFHVKSHFRSRATKAHEILPLKPRGGTSQHTSASSAHHVPIFCPRHDGIPAKLFCSEPCGQLVCYDCSVGEHSGHSIFLADSPDVEVAHRTRLTRQLANLRQRLAKVEGAMKTVESVKQGIEESTRAAEKAALQAFALVRQAIDARQKAMLKNLRGARATKTQHLVSQLRVLKETACKYTTALEITDHCLDSLQGDQLMAMEPDLRQCLEKHDADFTSLPMEPCMDNQLEFTYDKKIATAISSVISKLGCMASSETDFEHQTRGLHGSRRQLTSNIDPEQEHPVPPVHFTLAAQVGGMGKNSNNHMSSVGFSSPKSDTVVVEIRYGSEKDFLRTGREGPVMGRVVLETRLEGAQYLKYDSEHFFESLSQRVLTSSDDQTVRGVNGRRQKKIVTVDRTPSIRFTKRLRVAGRRSLDWHV